MKVKNIVKFAVGYLRCLKSGISYRGGVYVGRHVHFVNGKKIKLEKGVQIRPDTDIFAGYELVICEGCDIGTRNRIVGDVVLEKEVLLGPDNYLSSADHCYADINKSILTQGAVKVSKYGHSELRIGEGSWIGTHCAIIGCVHIGKHCVIGANTVVTKDIPDYCVAAGNPARIIRKYNFSTGEWERV